VTNDWVAVLARQGELARSVAATTTEMLNIPELEPEQIFRLYSLVEQGAGELDRIIARMEESGAELRLLEDADRLMDAWTELCVGTAKHLQAREGSEIFELSNAEDLH